MEEFILAKGLYFFLDSKENGAKMSIFWERIHPCVPYCHFGIPYNIEIDDVLCIF
jgi:hypothetical protein